MTTIAADREYMAADSKFTEAGVVFEVDKMHLIGGSIWGVCGETQGEGKFLAWVRAGMPDKDRPVFDDDDDKDDFSALQLNETGLYYWDRHLYGTLVREGRMAIGSGADIARYCMIKLKMPPEKAVAQAIPFDNMSGGPIKTMRL